MRKSEFIQLHKELRISIKRTFEYNPIPSDTDPTQDIPVKMIEVSAMGVPLNVKERKAVFSNLLADNLTSIEKRNNDKFDVLSELQNTAGKVSQTKIETNFIKQTPKQRKHED